jgi:hypothetical protein
MNEGAFAMLDCLGFKGVWQRGVEASQIIQFMKESESIARNSFSWGLVNESFPGMLEVHPAYVSDTIIFAVSLKQKPAAPIHPWAKGLLVGVAIGLAIESLQRFLKAPVPLSLRGCITYGEFLVDGPFFVGPAVDEAASFAEVANGSFVWVQPDIARTLPAYFAEMTARTEKRVKEYDEDALLKWSAWLFDTLSMLKLDGIEGAVAGFSAMGKADQAKAAKALMQLASVAQRRDLLLPYPMPLREGGTLDVPIVNPFGNLLAPEQIDLLARQYLAAYGKVSKLDLLAKRQNTLKFLAHARNTTLAEWSRIHAALRSLVESAQKGDVTGTAV